MNHHENLLPVYQRLRTVRLHLNNTLAGLLSKETLQASGRALGLLKRDILVFDSEDEMAILMDYAIYNVRPDGRNAVQRYLDESPPPPNSEQRAVLESMLRAYYSLVQIVDVERGVGVSVHDVLRDEPGFLVDIGFSATARQGMLMATRVIPSDGFLTTGGAAIPVLPEAVPSIRKQLERTFAPDTDFTHLSPAQEADLAALLIRNSLAAGASSRIAYAEPSQLLSPRDATHPVSARPRANRNDPCPCGSGRKYKSCCGKR
jgi:hypothetical protein